MNQMNPNNLHRVVRLVALLGVLGASATAAGACGGGESGDDGPDVCSGVVCAHGWCNRAACVCDSGWTQDSAGMCTVKDSGGTGGAADVCAGISCANGWCDDGSCKCNSGWQYDASGKCTVQAQTGSGGAPQGSCGCTTGAVQSCACANGVTGVQTCNSDCNSWSTCECAALSGSATLYDDKNYSDRSLTVEFQEDVPSMHTVVAGGETGFNDKASSVIYDIPAGWAVVLYDDTNYSDTPKKLTGKGQLADLGSFSDKCSSLRWEKQ